MILKKLRHPAIPIVYDLEEDQDYLYLVQEYLQGSSLYTLIRRQGVIQEAEAVRYGIQLCRLVQFLHSAGETPILHLDLHPNNLMICGGVVKIIDFGQAVFEGCRERTERCAAAGFASPEQYLSGESLDVRADLYAIGAVLSFMVRGLPNISPQLEQIISRCMETDREKRFQTADQVERRLKTVAGMGTAASDLQPKPSLVIAVVGSRFGAGATHLSLGLCAYLSSIGVEVLYVEKNYSGHMRCLAEAEGSRPDGYGIIRIGNCRIKPWYGESVFWDPVPADVLVCDYGCHWNLLPTEEPQRLVMIAGSSPWEIWDLERMMDQLRPWIHREKSSIFLIFRCLKKGRGLPGLKLEANRKVRRFCQPFIQNPLVLDEKGTEFFEELWGALAPSSESGRGRNQTIRKRRRGWSIYSAAKTLDQVIRVLAGRDAG